MATNLNFLKTRHNGEFICIQKNIKSAVYFLIRSTNLFYFNKVYRSKFLSFFNGWDNAQFQNYCTNELMELLFL